ncbi:MAG: type II secretion system major pseudopilin GspG [Rhodobacteraceae bacterium]|nr:type II secretion system major pseudopilin GspG [Paracoccaceae bacterium]
MRGRGSDRGFSLIELMVVVAILSILALVVVPRVMDRPDQARIARARTDLASLAAALDLYRLDNFAYPTTEQGLAALVARPALPPVPPAWAANGYVDRVPKDPWGGDYQYLAPGVHGPYDIFSFGADGATGGAGVNADIGTWMLN